MIFVFVFVLVPSFLARHDKTKKTNGDKPRRNQIRITVLVLALVLDLVLVLVKTKPNKM